MERKNFVEWLNENLKKLDEGRGLYGQSEGDDKVPFSMLDRIQDNDIAEGDWEAELTDLVMKWAKLPNGPAKDAYKKKVDDYAAKLLEIGNSPSRLLSIINRATHDQKGTFIRTARKFGR